MFCENRVKITELNLLWFYLELFAIHSRACIAQIILKTFTFLLFCAGTAQLDTLHCYCRL